MIQRIQTLYLLAATILLAAMFFLPSVRFYCSECMYAAEMNAVGILFEDNLKEVKWGVLVFSSLSILLSFIAIFFYKNRKRQIRITNIAALSILLQVVAIVVYSRVYAGRVHHGVAYEWTAALPFLAYVFVWMARKRIRKDEELVRAADRIR